MSVTNEKVNEHSLLEGMYTDDYFPDFLVDKIKEILLGLCERIEAEEPEDEEALCELTHAAVEAINELAEDFESNESELETDATEVIAAEFEFIARAYGFPDADVEELTAPRDW